MVRAQLHVDFGRKETAPARATPAADGVSVRLGDVAQLLADAVRSDRTWLYDFQDDEIVLSADLYEVLVAYRQLRRPYP